MPLQSRSLAILTLQIELKKKKTPQFWIVYFLYSHKTQNARV